MKTIHVTLKQNAYKICVGKGLLFKAASMIKRLSIGNDAIIITHPSINRLYGKVLLKGLRKSGFSVKVIEVPQGEHSKSARVAFKVMEEIARYDTYKRPFVIAFGGGVVGDLAGYIAAAYKRGIPYVQIPTTFLAQIDSAIGGKVAIDLPIGKNLVGAFHQPKIVISDTDVLKSLPVRQIRNGLAEAIKYGIIKDKAFFEYLSKQYKNVFTFNDGVLNKVVERCSAIKAQVVVKDEKETLGLRATLNFGHTIGHAIEAGGLYKVYQHGEAIGLGMRIATDLSYQLGLLSENNVTKINELISAVKLPEKIQKVKLVDILDHMKHDKKFTAGKNRFVLATQIGRVKLVEGVDKKNIHRAIKKFM